MAAVYAAPAAYRLGHSRLGCTASAFEDRSASCTVEQQLVRVGDLRQGLSEATCKQSHRKEVSCG